MSDSMKEPTFPLAHGPNASGHDMQAAIAQQTEGDAREALMRRLEEASLAAASVRRIDGQPDVRGDDGEGSEEGITDRSTPEA